MKCPNCASAIRADISTQLRQNLSHIMLKPNPLVGVVVRDIVIRASRGGSRRDVGDTSSPPAIFKHVFDEYSLSIISNLFDNIIENEQTKCVILGETFRFRGKKFKQNLPKNCSKSAKMATTVRKFSKNFRGA